MKPPIKILELRSVRGTGGGPEKTILLGAARSDARRFAITVAYVRDRRDPVFGVEAGARRLSVDYVEVRERHSVDLSILPALRDIVRAREIDIVHAHEYKTNALALCLSRMTGAIPLSTAHGWTGHSMRERLLYYPLDKRMLRAFPYVVAVSGEIRQTLERSGVRPERLRTLLNGIDHRAFRREPAQEAAARAALGLEPGSFAIGAVGRLEPQKRFDILIDAFAAVQARRPQGRLLIAGDGSQRALLEARIARLPAGVCSLLGHCTDVAQLHHGLDLLVQSSDYEGTPNAVLEAMAFETPIVATTAGGTAEIVRGGLDGLLVPPGDPRALAHAIVTVIDDRAEAFARAKTARRRVENELSFDARQSALEHIYEQLVAARDAGRERRASVRWASHA